MRLPDTTKELTLGDLRVVFHKTERVPDDAKNAALPPSLGHFSLYKVSYFKDRCPESWDPEGVFIPVQKTEAMWMSFQPGSPVAMTVGAGGINAVTGKKLAAKLEKDGYIVAPPQPWLDGWKNEDGTVRQFVCAEYKGGEGITVGEQLIGEESKTGGIAIAVFEPKKPLPAVATPGHYSNTFGMELCTLDGQMAPVKTYCAASAAPMAEMGIGAGGKIDQKIYPDPYGLKVWKTKPSFTACVYLVSAEDFHNITGQKLAEPATQKHPGFTVVDGHLADVPGTGVFEDLIPATADSKVDKKFFPG